MFCAKNYATASTFVKVIPREVYWLLFCWTQCICDECMRDLLQNMSHIEGRLVTKALSPLLRFVVQLVVEEIHNKPK